MDPWLTWFVVNTAALSVPGIAVWGLGLGLVWLGLRRKVGCIALLGLPLIFIAGAWTYLLVSPLPEKFNMMQLSRELGLPPPKELFTPTESPSERLMARITPGLTTRRQVHEILRFAKARYECPREAAEKYLLYAERYSWDTGPPDGIIVFYNGDGVVSKKASFGGSFDPLPQQRCEAEPASPATG